MRHIANSKHNILILFIVHYNKKPVPNIAQAFYNKVKKTVYK